ncbi:lasso peptide biosynthesis PqqD family chaperone [Guptibacillus spartinae]|uniref:lasso peptide biosynthesis PqqD family chaperone n=1 Tax=Guptibacillus spartinae TaxID=3025679 RepID=UPI00235F0EE0|nr:lasso peptide biosynthesis PqqD family chaperone [Pseudalkalibacillus spartinae]
MLKNSLINPTQLVSQVPGNIASDMDGEKVILSIENGKYYNLGEVGGEIWSRLSKPIRLNTLITNLMEEFNVGRDVCEADVQYFLGKLLDEGLVKVD